MLRSFGISLLFLGLLAAGYEGFRDRVRTAAPSAATTETGGVHTADYGAGVNPPR